MAETFNYQNLYKVPTQNVGPDGKPVYDIYNAGSNQKYSYEQLLPEFQQGLNTEFIQIKPTVTPLTPESLSTAQPFPLKVATPPTTYPVDSLVVPDLKLTPNEEKASNIGKELEGLYSSVIGKTAFREEQEAKFGVDTAMKNINDLSAQLTSLKNEAAAIPLRIEEKVAKEGAIGTAGLKLATDSELRRNAIAALSVSSLLAASQGQLANAKALADRAVSQKYDPVAEKIATLQANLKLIQDDPESTIQEKNRAAKQIEIQNKKAQELSRQQKNETEIWDLATTAATNANAFTPAGQYTNLSMTLQAISQAKTKEEALQIAQITGLLKDVPKNVTTSDMAEYNLAKSQGYKGTFQQWVDRSSKYKATGGGGKTPAEIQAERDSAFEKFVTGITEKVVNGTLNREQAKAQIKTLYPEYNENVIYDMVPG